jgi:uncharacterized protein YndB with AHSA1/START domain
MNKTDKTILTAEVEINARIEKVWKLWNAPEAIMQWNNLSDDWHNTKVENDLCAGGRFLFAMGLKDGSFNFDFCGIYDKVEHHKRIAYTLDDGRKTNIVFSGQNPVKVTEDFEANTTDDIDMQKGFCQAVLDRFKRYVEQAV